MTIPDNVEEVKIFGVSLDDLVGQGFIIDDERSNVGGRNGQREA